MRTNVLRTTTGRLSCLVLAALTLLAAAAPAGADEVAEAGASGDRIFEARVQAGYGFADADDNRAFLLPYQPLESSPLFGFELLYLEPSFGTLGLEGAYLGTNAWDASLAYERGAKLDLAVSTRKFTHAREHKALPGSAVAPTGFGALETESHDADPDAEYEDIQFNNEASLKVRVPGYPAHFTANAKITQHTGEQQMQYFFRSCSTELCHMKSRTRAIDQVTETYNLGADAHVGPVDVAYTRSFLSFRDRKPMPVDAFGDLTYQPGQSSTAGDYPHDVNPDLRGFTDALKLNTNLTNRMVVSLAYDRQEQENQPSGITRGDQHAGLDASYVVSPSLYLVARLDYEQERTLELSREAEALRTTRNLNHAKSGENHQHAVRPEYSRWNGELALRWIPRPGTALRLSLGRESNESTALIEKKNGVWDDSARTTRSTIAALDGRWRIGQALELDGLLGQEWTSAPEYATASTRLTRFGLGAGWSPSPLLTLRADYRGYRGRNDDAGSLQMAYAKQAQQDPGFSRATEGDAVTLTAAYVPSKGLTLTAAYAYSGSGIEQDLMFGAPSTANAGNFFFSPDTQWSGRTHFADLRAAWALTSRLTLTGEGMWMQGRESYAPDIAAGADLEELGTVDVSKLYASLQADLRITEAVGLAVTGFWTRYDDRQDEAGDGSATGVLTTIDMRW